MTLPSERARSIGHFLVMEILERAQELEAAGRDIIHLEVGEPDFPTPANAVKAGVSALEAGRTRYTHSLGIPRLRDAIAGRLSDHGAGVDPSRIVVTVGSSAGLLLAFATLCDEGEEIIVTDPGYPCYSNIARALGVRTVRVPIDADTGFTYDPDRVRLAIGPRTRAIVVNSPANPTGVVTPPDVLEALAHTGLPLVSDEIYQGLVYEGTATSALKLQPEAFVVGGFSKRYAMTGWRLGYLVVPSTHLRAVQALQQNLFISASEFGQWAALEALDAHEDVEAMRLRFDERRRFLLEALPRIGLPVPVRPKGAFYVFADARAFTTDSMSFAIELLEATGVAVTPGIDFGPRGEGYLRFSYATSLERIQEAVTRLGDYLATR